MRERRRLFWLFLAGGVLAGGMAMGVPHDFEASKSISARAMNENFESLEAELEALKTQALIPSGAVTAYAGRAEDVPVGWRLCNGDPLSRTQYKSLFDVIGTVYGVGDGVTTFNLPDYRGRFLRGVDLGRGMDPDAEARAGGAPGDLVGSQQGDDLRAHGHAIADYRGIGIGMAKFGLPPGTNNTFNAPHRYNNGNNTVEPDAADAWHALLTGGSETRPANIAVHYIIRL